MDFLYYGMVAVGAVFFITTLTNLIKVAYYSRKGEKIICPSCGSEILKMGNKFKCYGCKSNIIIENGEPKKG